MSLNYSNQCKLLNVHVRQTKYEQKTQYTNCSQWKLSLSCLSIFSFSSSSKSSLIMKIKIGAELSLHNYMFSQWQRIFSHRLVKHKNDMENEWCRKRHPSTKESHLCVLPATSTSPKIAASSWQKSQSPSLKVNTEVSGGTVPKLMNMSECQNFCS